MTKASTGSGTADAGPPVPGGETGENADSFQARKSAGRSGLPWKIASASLLIEGAILRLYDLGLTPLHHDEGVNGFFLVELFRHDTYQYNPENYHGPSLYYFALASSYLFGLNTFAIRFVPAVFGIATVWLVLKLRPWIGSAGALGAAALVTASPGAVYISRYFIHETLFVFFTLAIVVAALHYRDGGRPRHLLMAAAAAALLLATKETWVISAVVLVAAPIAGKLYLSLRARWQRGGRGRGLEGPGFKEELPGYERENRFQGRGPAAARSGVTSGSPLVLWIEAGVVFVFVSALLYSSLLSNPAGILEALRTLEFWVQTGKNQHAHAWYQYLSWLWQEEAPILLLGAMGGAVSIWLANNRFSLVAALWAVGLLISYSIVPYKTPWLALNFVVPLAISAACGLGAVCERAKKAWQRAAVLMIAAASVAVCTAQAISLSFFHYDDDRYAYVYAHTSRDFFRLVDDVGRAAARAGTGSDTTIAVTAPEYWPLPWYLRNYKYVGYFGRVTESASAIVIGAEDQGPDLDSHLGSNYQRMGSYQLRPGVTLLLYARADSLGK